MLSGTSTGGEYFSNPDDVPPTTIVETCAMVEWMQFTWQMFRLTGDMKYADELERLVYNALPTAQHPVSGLYCYFDRLNGKRDPNDPANWWKMAYNGGQTCCQNSLIRGMSWIPFIAAGTLNNNPMVLLYLSGDHQMDITGQGGSPVSVKMHIDTRYPETGSVSIAVNPSASATFNVQLYVPSWCSGFSASVGGQTFSGTPSTFLGINRLWSSGDTIKLAIQMKVRLIWDGYKSTPRYYAIQRGPQLLSADDAVTGTTLPAGWGGSQVYDIGIRQNGQVVHRIMVPYAEAGQMGVSNFTTLGDSVYLVANDSATRASHIRTVSGNPGVHMAISNHSIILHADILGNAGSFRDVAVYMMDGRRVFSLKADKTAALPCEVRIPISAKGAYVVHARFDGIDVERILSYDGK
jgi:hypothetical protein